ncbi:membrane protein [Mycobacterium mantenii]|uniref:Membrane protein n=1 Tax=Mycobacterium mantenii TaxID=560555 RepID=A0A1X0F9P3_MYCNT|nr:hypothetical protein [Mycobacterium mantenii]MCV7246465.1 hypothetical protein [Mycobacterium mantenii]ORA98493.1 hypothetical protein BST30_25770 [Mycobacterium mantenii]BBY38558.1 membrane protein [Mycobacterium mantenii]
MEPFTLRLPWGPMLRLFSRNPLVRKVDRVEAVLMLGAVVVALLAAPFGAAAVGTAVHDVRGHLYAEQAQTRHAVLATLTDLHAAGAESAPPHGVINTPARPVLGRTAHGGAVDTAPTVQIGDRVGIWVDDDVQQVDEPAALSRAANEAVAAALVTWVIVVVAAAGLLASGRVILNCVRNTGWQHDIDNLLCRGGQTNIQPWRPRVAYMVHRRARGLRGRGAR